MRKVTATDRIRYAFDNAMSQGPIALIVWLLVITLLIILAFSAGMLLSAWLFQGAFGERGTFGEIFWLNLGTVLAPELADGEHWIFRIENLIVAMMGILLVSILIGLITTGIEGRLQELRKGRSFVLEQNHTVILGWSEQIFAVLAELAAANANQRRPVVALLGDGDKVEMEDTVRQRVGDLQNTRLVVRSGSPTDPSDLEIVNPYNARAIIILPPETGDPDIAVVKTLLAITNIPTPPGHRHHIVTCLQDVRNRRVAELVGKDAVSIVMADDLIARLTVQTSLQAGLSIVYTDLLDFGGDEIYFKTEPALVGKTFADALQAFAGSTAIGLHKQGEGAADGQTLLNPAMSTVIEPGDQVVVIAEDDDTTQLGDPSLIQIDETAILARQPQPAIQQRRILILGWNRRGPFIVAEFDRYVGAGSDVLIVCDVAEEELRRTAEWGTFTNLTVVCRQGDTTSRRLLNSLEIQAYDQVLVLSDADQYEAQEADARTLITLLHLRDMAERGQINVSITSEMIDTRNRDLAAITQADDFIISEQLVSLLLAQIAENRQLHRLFDDLFGVEGSEIYLKPAAEFIATGRPVNFYTVVEAARRRGEVAIGYRLMRHAGDPTKAHGVRLNPVKGETIHYEADDLVIVLAEK